MIATLPMYDWPEIRPATDAFWQAAAARLAAEGIAAPEGLSRPADPAEAWADPALVLGQSCGMPFVSGRCGSARVVARPDYGLEDARDGLYRSVIVARAGEARRLTEWRGARLALNEWGSFSGHIALRAHLTVSSEGAPFFSAAILTGSHRQSARLVAAGGADIAALDAVAWALLQAHEPATAGRLSVIEHTALAPALPFIAAARFAALAPALARALDAAAGGEAPLGLPRRVLPAGDADYAPIRAAAGVAARQPLAPGAPSVPAL